MLFRIICKCEPACRSFFTVLGCNYGLCRSGSALYNRVFLLYLYSRSCCNVKKWLFESIYTIPGNTGSLSVACRVLNIGQMHDLIHSNTCVDRTLSTSVILCSESAVSPRFRYVTVFLLLALLLVPPISVEVIVGLCGLLLLVASCCSDELVKEWFDRQLNIAIVASWHIYISSWQM